MPFYAIQQYHAEVEKLIHYGGTNNEMTVRNAFSRLLDHYAQSRDLKLVPEVPIKTKAGKLIRPDGTLKDALRLDHGYWESKDKKDNIQEEIRKKFNKDYPFENILFEDSSTAVLFQNNIELLRVPMSNGEELDKLLNLFVRFEREEVKEFHKAIEHFKQDIPKVTQAIHQVITDQKNNIEFNESLQTFLKICQQSINPAVTIPDIEEMLVQHILSADIFNTIFDEPHFHQENNIAREINKVIESFFVGRTRRSALSSIKHYYDTINAKAATIADHHEKQKFLKAIYENFYKAYNPKAADRLGIVYTPNEIVRFMIESTDLLLDRHFDKALADKNVEILDPATGTGTFICDIIDHLKHSGGKKLEYKYKHELHANEVAILPYYIANLNIEYTYKQATNNYAEFENLCFVDTLDNTAFGWHGKQVELFSVSTENTVRIKKQNERKISVIIGNPPYNANQASENENNKNREYPEIDKRIKETYISKSTAQKTKAYDMYARFYRWASDRIQEDGIICFITNNSFINARTFDGFRKCVQDEFQYAYFIDLGGNIRELSGKDGIFLNEKNTIFGEAAAVGIVIGFLIKNKQKSTKECQINYTHPCDIRATRDDKIAFLQSHKFTKIDFTRIAPDKNSNWINIAKNDFEDLIPLRIKNSNSADGQLFLSTSLGISTNRDEWVYDLKEDNLTEKICFFINEFNKDLNKRPLNGKYSDLIKWSRDLKSKFSKSKALNFKKDKIRKVSYRPFNDLFIYANKILIDRLTDKHFIFKGHDLDKQNLIIHYTDVSSEKPFMCLASESVSDLHFVGSGAGTMNLPFFLYNNGERIDNITNWGLNKFQEYYKIAIIKKDLFYYVYAVLNNPDYRKKYELNLKRDFPRIPFYENFFQWVKWGKELMDLHINYESITPYKLMRKEITKKTQPKPKLKALKEHGIIQLDENTELRGIPREVWDYKLGNRSALEWVLDQYKEKKVSDLTIAKRFNTFHFQDYKEQVINLIMKICTVSIQTMEITSTMSQFT